MKKWLKLLPLMYSRHGIREMLLALEMVALVILLVMITNPVAYFLKQEKLTDSLWNDGRSIYYTSSYSATAALSPEEAVREYPEVEAFYQGQVADYFLSREDSTGSFKLRGVAYNAAMRNLCEELFEDQAALLPEDVQKIYVTKDMADDYPAGTPLLLRDSQDRELPCVVAGILQEELLPCFYPSYGTYKTIRALTVHTEENLKNGYLSFVMVKEDMPVTAGMFRVKEGTDTDALAMELTKRYVNCGEFRSYDSMKFETLHRSFPVGKVYLLSAGLFLLIFLGHFSTFLVVSTVHKERTNALLSANGMSPGELSFLNALSLLLVMLPAYLVGIFLAGTVEEAARNFPYGGHGLFAFCLLLMGLISLTMIIATVRIRMKKRHTILLYKEG